MTLLKKAIRVTALVINSSPCFDNHGEQRGTDIALIMARHRIKVNVLAQTTQLDNGNAVVYLSADVTGGVIVKGGFSHARIREMLVGGYAENHCRAGHHVGLTVVMISAIAWANGRHRSILLVV